MKTSIRLLAMMALGLALLATTGCSKLRARDQLNKGVQSYKNAKYEEAINHFQQAVSLDPSLLERTPLPGHRICPAIYSRRRHRGQQQHGRERHRSIQVGA